MYKNQLQELAQRSCLNLPSYTSIREGPDHAPRFKAVVNFNGESFESPHYCSTLRQAEYTAAEVASARSRIGGPRTPSRPGYWVRETNTSLNARKIISKKTISKSKSARRRDRRLKRLKPYDLSALSEVLPELTEPQEPAPAKFNQNSKFWQKLVLKEGKQLMTLLSHPAFQLDPHVAIHHHLQQTQPIEDKKPVSKKTGGAKKKKKKSKSTVGSRPMDL